MRRTVTALILAASLGTASLAYAQTELAPAAPGGPAGSTAVDSRYAEREVPTGMARWTAMPLPLVLWLLIAPVVLVALSSGGSSSSSSSTYATRSTATPPLPRTDTRPLS